MTLLGRAWPGRCGAFCVGAALCLLVWPAPAVAQGNGRGNAYGHYKAPSTGGRLPAGAPDVALPGTAIPIFASWLDDASLMPEGRGFVSFGFGYWKLPDYSELDVPVIDSGVALHRRVQVGASVRYFHARQPGIPVVRGLGDVLVSTKIQLREPSPRGVGFAVTPLVEVLSAAPMAGGSRLHWGLPGSVELRRSGWRAFGTAGYFSRGSLFASGAIDVAVSERVWVTGSISQAHSLRGDDGSVAPGVARTRIDVSGGASMAVGSNLAIFGSLGRTVSTRGSSGTALMLTGGVSVNLRAW